MSFLALLELVKQGMAMAEQENAFGDISVKNMDKLIIQLESVLFLKGEPASINWLAKTFDKKKKK